MLITGNRNADDPKSLETTIRTRNDERCLPVLTFADADRIFHEREYAGSVVERLLDVLLDLDELLGTGRLYLP